MVHLGRFAAQHRTLLDDGGSVGRNDAQRFAPRAQRFRYDRWGLERD